MNMRSEYNFDWLVIDGASASNQQSVTFKPHQGSSDIEVRVEIMWRQVVYKYTYRLVQ